MLKEQLAKLQSELRIARAQQSPANHDHPQQRRPASQQQQPPHPNDSPSTTTTSTSTPSPHPRIKSHSIPAKSRSNRKISSSPPSSDPPDGLSIRFISGPGISSSQQPRSPHHQHHHPSPSIMDHHPSPSIMDHHAQLVPDLPITDSGYIKDPNGVWVAIKTPLAHTPITRRPSTSRCKSHSPAETARGFSRIPISAVTLGRVLAGDPHVPDHHSSPSYSSSHHPANHLVEENQPVDQEYTSGCSDPHTSGHSSGASLSSPMMDDQATSSSSEPSTNLSQSTLASRQPRSNPFFSSGGGRDRGAMIHQAHHTDRGANGGNTGKVITTLQSDLLYARTTLDQSKSQLRLSQRAVESLTRQNEDLKESMSRLRLENEGLSKMLSRKERTVSELMERVKKSESELSTLKQEKKELDINHKKLSKETDEVVKDSIRRRDRAEIQYEAVRSGVKSLSEGWKRDVTDLKQDIARLEEKHRKELEDSRIKYNTLAKLHASRSGALSRIESDINNLQSSKASFLEKYRSELSELKNHLESEQKLSTQGLELALEVSNECARFKRILRNHNEDDHPNHRPPSPIPSLSSKSSHPPNSRLPVNSRPKT